MPTHHRAKARQLWLTWTTGLTMVCLWDFTGWDRTVMQLWGDADGFPLEHHPLLETWLHGRLRTLGWLLYVSCWLWAIWPHDSRMADRTDRMALMGVVTLNLVLINVLKFFSTTSCPWSVSDWGGVAQYLSHWQWGVPDGGPGHCFPSGHAATAWSFAPLVLAAWWPLLQDRSVAQARLITVVFFTGAVLTGVAQTLRGAHYPSHWAWTAVICCGVALLYWTLRQGMNRAAPSAS
jgi:membrane-associated PAP2 superfamily phosphatase